MIYDTTVQRSRVELKKTVTRQSEMADLARRATSVCTKFHRDRLRND